MTTQCNAHKVTQKAQGEGHDTPKRSFSSELINVVQSTIPQDPLCIDKYILTSKVALESTANHLRLKNSHASRAVISAIVPFAIEYTMVNLPCVAESNEN